MLVLIFVDHLKRLGHGQNYLMEAPILCQQNQTYSLSDCLKLTQVMKFMLLLDYFKTVHSYNSWKHSAVLFGRRRRQKIVNWPGCTEPNCYPGVNSRQLLVNYRLTPLFIPPPPTEALNNGVRLYKNLDHHKWSVILAYASQASQTNSETWEGPSSWGALQPVKVKTVYKFTVKVIYFVPPSLW